MAEGMLNNAGAVSTGDPTTISQGAQDIAKATGVAYEDVAKQEEDRPAADYQDYDAAGTNQMLNEQTAFKPASNYVDEAKSTVAGQLTSLLDQNSAYVQQARQQATEQASGRGLLNSTIAANQGQRAAIQSALPIAQQDAQTWANAQGARQQAEYGQETIKSEAIVSGALVEQKAAIQQKQTEINNAFQARMQGMESQNQVWAADFQNQFNKGMQELEQAHQQQMLTMELNQNQAAAVAEHSASIMQNYQVSVENMMQDPDFLGMGKEAVNNAINQLQNLAANSIGFIGASQGVNMDVWLDEYLETMTVMT